MSQVKPKVYLITHTPNPEEVIAMSARLCYSDADVEELAEKTFAKNQDKFLKKLMSFGHVSPIEHANFTFGVEGVSRSFLAQITRHRIASFSVKSQRYVGEVHKKGSESFNYIVPKQIEELGASAIAEYAHQMETMQGWYDNWVERLGNKGESSFEDARFVLPNAAESKMFFTMNARALMHFFELRCCNRAQWEIRDVAWQMLGLCLEAAPVLFENAGPTCIAGKCSEGKMTCGRPYKK